MPFVPDFRGPGKAPDPRLTEQQVVRCLEPFLGSEQRRSRIEQVLLQRLASITLVLERPHDPHNGAAVLRSAEALGLLHVHVIEGEEAFGAKRKVSRGAHKWLNVHVHDRTEGCLRGLRAAGFKLWAALPPPLAGELPGELSPGELSPGELAAAESLPALQAAVGAERIDARTPVALVFGSEHVGLTPEAIALCHGRFHVPMFGFCESFNLSVSAALALAQVTAARRLALGRAGDLPPAARSRLRAAYYARSVRNAHLICWHWLQSQGSADGPA